MWVTEPEQKKEKEREIEIETEKAIRINGNTLFLLRSHLVHQPRN